MCHEKSRKIIIVYSIIMAMREQSKKHELMSKEKMGTKQGKKIPS
jgi:hypothetical protein